MGIIIATQAPVYIGILNHMHLADTSICSWPMLLVYNDAVKNILKAFHSEIWEYTTVRDLTKTFEAVGV